MYIRMLIVMLVTLFTSRIMLRELGVSNYGVYNAIAGFIVLLSFLNSGLSIITQRNITYELGQQNGDVDLIYSISIRMHLYIIGVILLLAETVGLWFVNSEMNFPPNQIVTVNWLYQLSLLSAFVNIIKVPASALILSNEKMSFYAYTSILEAFLKVAIVYALSISNFDKLIVYGFLLLAVNVVITIWQFIYCKLAFPKIRYTSRTEKNTVKRILSLSGWTFFGSFASLGCQQGDNLIINIFYGVLFNASVGIANQVNGALSQLVSGFQQALNPQLVKSEAAQNKEQQKELLYSSTKLSFFIMFVVAIPIICNLDYILKIWLDTVPPETATICMLIIAGALIEAISGPLWMTIYATGDIKTYQLLISVLFLVELPIAYLIGKTGNPITMIFIVRILLYGTLLGVRLAFLKKLIQFNIRDFLIKVIFRLFLSVALIMLTISIVQQHIAPAASPLQLLFSLIMWGFFSIVICFSIGLNNLERQQLSKALKTVTTKLFATS